MIPSLHHYLALSLVLFLIGTAGVLIRRNALIVLMSLEMMLNAANLAFVAFARFQGNADGQVIAFTVMAIAAAEVAVGLAIIVRIFALRKTINVDLLTTMKG